VSTRGSKRRKLTGRQEGGSFSAWPHACHAADSFIALSLPARALLFELLGQLRAANNGDLSCAFGILGPRGWRSRTTIESARQELETAGWIIRTRQGGRNMPNLYAVAWRQIDDCGGKLDIPAGPPPGTWRQPKKQNGMPSKWAPLGQEMGNLSPSAGQPHAHVAQQMVKSA